MRGLLCLSLTLVAATAMHTATQASMAAHSSVHGALKTVVTALVPLFLALVPTIFLLNTADTYDGTSDPRGPLALLRGELLRRR